jgi:adenosylmethionine-8-amino-7-oxononanoate transaminase
MKTSHRRFAEQLERKDKKYLWHPFTQMREWESENILMIKKGKGVWLWDVRGRKYLDGVSSLWCNVHGHRVKAIDRAVSAQLRRIAHSTFLGLSNVPAVELAEKLVQIAPKGLSRVFYSDSGSEAVEIALKMAFQYWRQKGAGKKTKFVKLTNAYHGDTLGSVSVGGIDLFHRMYNPLLFQALEIPAPNGHHNTPDGSPARAAKTSLCAMEKIFQENHGEIAALIMEPLIQGAAGMMTHPAGYLAKVRKLTKQYNVLLILDEVATGFGRTGTMFACDQEKVVPDLLTAAKGLTGGYLPLAATLATEEIYDAFLGRHEEYKTFFHGHTYTANPLACSAALASLKLFKTNRIFEKLPPKIKLLTKRLKDFYRIPMVGDVRQVGLMAGIELVKNRQTREPFETEEKIGVQVILKAREKGAILRPLGPVVVLMPPLAIRKEELNQLLDITYQSIVEVDRIASKKSGRKFQ